MGWFHAAFAAGEIGSDGDPGGTCAAPPPKVAVPPCPKTLTGVEVIYHMCERAHWEEAVERRGAYFPPTFHKDGKFTRAGVFQEGLIDTANHFYKDNPGVWICLEINLKLLLDMGIVVLPQEEEPAETNEDGKEEKNDSATPVQCLQVFSGITTVVPGLITNIYPMKRSPCGSGTFLALGDPISFKARRHPTVKEETPKKVAKPVQKQEVTNIPGIGKVPAAAPEQPKKTKSGGLASRMFGTKSKK